MSRVIQLDREGMLKAIRDSAGRRLYHPRVVERFARAREARKAAKHVSDEAPVTAGACR